MPKITYIDHKGVSRSIEAEIGANGRHLQDRTLAMGAAMHESR